MLPPDVKGLSGDLLTIRMAVGRDIISMLGIDHMQDIESDEGGTRN